MSLTTSMPRPATVKKHPTQLKFFLRQIQLVHTQKFTRDLYVLGNTSDRNSVAVHVQKFVPYFYLDYHESMGDVNDWMQLMNDELRPWANATDVITFCEIVERVPLVGFCNNQKRRLLKISYGNPANLPRLRKHFEQPVCVGNKIIRLYAYHQDWSVENLFLFETGLKIMQWVEVTSFNTLRKKTTCDIERWANWKFFSPTEPLCVLPPVLCGGLRMRADCAISDKANLVLPDAESSGDKILTLVLLVYWMGEPEKSWSFSFDNIDEKKLLQEFEQKVNHLDIDVFVYLSDNTNVLNYIVSRNADIRLSKFKNQQVRQVRINSSAKIHRVIIFGRDSADMKCALQKMQVQPPLEGYSLKDAIRHPKIFRHDPPKELLSYSFLLAASKHYTRKELLQHCYDEIACIRTMDNDGAMLLGLVELTNASFTGLTMVVRGGQQIRVYNKLCSKFHTGKLVINRRQLLKPPLVVKLALADSSYPDPPLVDNDRRQPEASRKPKNTLFRSLIPGHKPISFEQTKEQKKKPKPSKKKFEGGKVFDPKLGCYSNSGLPTVTLDFASLYPSIIRGYRICYMRLVFDQEYQDDPRFYKEYIPINSSECIVMVCCVREIGSCNLTMCRTILPETISEVCQQRSRVKKVMKNTTDPFLLAMLDAKQKGCKVFQNAVYGFLGVQKNAMLSVPVLMAAVCRVGRFMIKNVAFYIWNYKKGNIIYGDTDSVMCQFPVPDQLKSKSDIFSFVYETATKVAEDTSKLFNAPNRLEFETVKQPFLLYGKKCYAAVEYPGSDVFVRDTLSKAQVSIKGLAFKKRDRCPWVRKAGDTVVRFLLSGEEHKIKSFLRIQIDMLISRQISHEDLSITCLIQSPESYKVDNLIQVQTARKISQRSGCVVEPGTRLPFVVICDGQKKLYQRGEDPVFAKKNKLPLDLNYYLQKQFLAAINPLLVFHKHLCVNKKEISGIMEKIKQKSTGVRLLSAYTKKKRPFTANVPNGRDESKKPKLYDTTL